MDKAAYSRIPAGRFRPRSAPRYRPLRRFALALLGTTILATLATAPAVADPSVDDEIKSLKGENKELKARLDRMQKAIDALLAQQQAPAPSGAVAAATSAAQQAAAQAASAEATAVAAAQQATAAQTTIQAAAAKDRPFLQHKDNAGLTFTTPNGEITGYGNLDVSIDDSTKGISNLTAGGNHPIGRVGWNPDISTNLSYVGVRGFQNVGDSPLRFIYQLETDIQIAATAGLSESNSNQSDQVKGALTTRNSYIGLASADWGSLMIGKTDAPYKQSTARMNPFTGMIGDYAVIMGNTGGDNRVEFATRLDHSIWYESPDLSGIKFAALWSPGQNRASSSDNIAAGESDCTGGNIPGSGGIFAQPFEYACNDGSFSDAVSASLSYTNGPLYLVAAYERHMKVNRQSDLTGLYVTVPANLYAQDVADEDAAKIGIQYAFPTRTVVSAIFEDLHRYVPQDLQWQNERQRTGWWLAVSQQVTADDSVHIGWAHANRAPGDPGQHNDSVNTPPEGNPLTDATAGPDSDNTSNMVTAALKHKLAEDLTVYFDWAYTINGPAAHYDLGAGGRAVTTDCHDASDSTGDEFGNPHCWAGGHLMGVSLGLDYRF
jgi:predicted porin